MDCISVIISRSFLIFGCLLLNANAGASCSNEEVKVIDHYISGFAASQKINSSDYSIKILEATDACRFTLAIKGYMGRDGKEQHSNILYINKNNNNYELMPDGPSIEYFDSFFGQGQKRAEYFFQKGLKEGVEIRWFKNGIRQSSAEYKNGKLNGNETIWNDKGEIISNKVFKDDIAVESAISESNKANEYLNDTVYVEEPIKTKEKLKEEQKMQAESEKERLADERKRLKEEQRLAREEKQRQLNEEKEMAVLKKQILDDAKKKTVEEKKLANADKLRLEKAERELQLDMNGQLKTYETTVNGEKDAIYGSTCKKYGFKIGTEGYKRCIMDIELAEQQSKAQLAQFEEQKRQFDEQQRQYEYQQKLYQQQITEQHAKKERDAAFNLLMYGLGLAGGKTSEQAAPALYGLPMYPSQPKPPVFQNYTITTPRGITNCTYNTQMNIMNCF